ncbi:alpha/beta hydrolase [Aerosakkonemataceae cyanobacterium BLCC-F50]|uniref:Alpha/beta hydrolase n=1 Tax=Floridaenema flaviceps BLCC-F50 TaxID=3153642 RepID=A0ABV4XT25_9CYAN
MSNSNHRQSLFNRARVTGLTIALTTLSIVATIASFNFAVADNPRRTDSSQNTTPLSTQDLKLGFNRVTFQSEGTTLVGNLYLPASYKSGDKLPAIVVAGAWITVKEQMATLYAKKLSEQGFATLAFDFRYYGESGGEPRQYESASAKIQDIKNAITYLQSVSAIDSDRIAGLGICFGAGYMAKVAAEDNRLKSFATVAAWMHDRESLNKLFGEEVIQKRMQAGIAARKEYEATGKVQFVPAFTTKKDPLAAMTGEPIYYGNPKRGSIPEWKNQFALMSWPEWIEFNALAVAPKVNTPTLFVHSDGSALPENVRRFYNTMPGPKKLFWTEGQHLDFYDQEAYVTKAVQALTEHFQTTLSTAQVSQK